MISKINDIFSKKNSRTYIIAELSANHNGSKNIALESIEVAKEIGADAVKIQTYTAETITLDSKEKDFLIDGGTLWDGKNLYDLYSEAHTPWEWHQELFNHAKKIGIDLFSSPFDRSAVDFLYKFNPPAYKIASFEITDYDLIRYTASKGKPIIISTGIGTKEEIKDVVDICKQEGNDKIALLKCTSAYPAPLEEANLLTIPDLAKTFNVISGFSDHTLGATAAVAAVTLGAKIIEKHFIIDKSIGGPDSDFSLDKKEFSNMIQQIRDTEKLLGIVDYSMSEKKRKSRRFSRSLYVSKSIQKGEKISDKNIKSVRPGYGLHPKYLKDILGKKVKKNLKIGSRVKIDDIEL